VKTAGLNRIARPALIAALALGYSLIAGCATAQQNTAAAQWQAFVESFLRNALAAYLF
jgi:hypothetical protein